MYVYALQKKYIVDRKNIMSKYVRTNRRKVRRGEGGRSTVIITKIFLRKVKNWKLQDSVTSGAFGKQSAQLYEGVYLREIWSVLESLMELFLWCVQRFFVLELYI